MAAVRPKERLYASVAIVVGPDRRWGWYQADCTEHTGWTGTVTETRDQAEYEVRLHNETHHR